VAKGLVISQAPQAAVPINPGDTVAFVVSKGPVPPKVSVPNINGKTEADAKKALEAVGLVAAPSQAYSGTVVKGSVFGQNPSSGVKVDPGAKVTFVVSLGKGTQAVTVPNVVGKSQADAETALRNAGLVPSVVQQKSATVAKGVVAAQSPAAGATTAKGAVIGIVVSLGPDSSVSVPNVVGMTAADAEAAITAAGLVPSAVEQPDGEIPKGTVITQAPAAGTKAALGTTVLFTVSSGPPPPPQ
jgi:serine/threonine-protein kinase